MTLLRAILSLAIMYGIAAILTPLVSVRLTETEWGNPMTYLYFAIGALILFLIELALSE